MEVRFGKLFLCEQSFRNFIWVKILLTLRQFAMSLEA